MISDVRLQHFRSYTDESIEPDNGVNIIVGPNGSGKTNLLEALLVLCRGYSYRANERDLVEHGKEWARLDGHVANQERIVRFELQGGTIKKTYTVGSTNLQRLNHTRTVPVVLFEPNHMQLLTESPELRRTFLDDVVEQTVPVFGELRRQYKRALSQRNSLLKQTFTPDQLFVWNVRLSELGGQVVQHRLDFINMHQKQLKQLYSKLSGKRAKTELVYETKLPTENYSSAFLKALEDRLAIDQERGFTTVGPHRDDLGLYLAGYPLAAAASRGETRTMLLALKLLEVQSVERARDTKPILLLDDVFSELDGARRRALTDYLRDHQTFITTTDADVVIQHFVDSCKVIPTTGG